MAFTENNTIGLKSFWFEQEPQVLQAEALSPPFFHGPMTAEPVHVLTHEFGHVFCSNFQQGWKARAEVARLACTRATPSALDGYALGDPDEFTAELFALCELGFASHIQRVMFYEITGVLGSWTRLNDVIAS